MARNVTHEMQAMVNHDELARQNFIAQMKMYLGTAGLESVRHTYHERVLPEIEKSKHRPPKSAKEIKDAMLREPEYQIWATMYRGGQEQLWQAVEEPLRRCESELSERYDRLANAKNKHGSLHLDCDMQIPAAVRSVEIHLQPGGYALNRHDKDFLAGALYEAGGAVYSRSVGVGAEESKAECIIRYLGEWYPAQKPRKILDMGCSAGGSSVDYASVFPEAQVHAIDVAPALLRFAHARAEALEEPVHFHQMRAEDTRFPDESFDLIVSHNLLHELSEKARRGMMKECFRLLKPGGVCVHQDVPIRFSELTPYEQFERGWDARSNGEPFWNSYAVDDFVEMLVAGGFDSKQIRSETVVQLNGRTRWNVVRADKP